MTTFDVRVVRFDTATTDSADTKARGRLGDDVVTRRGGKCWCAEGPAARRALEMRAPAAKESRAFLRTSEVFAVAVLRVAGLRDHPHEQ